MLQTLSFPINDTTLHAVHKGYGPPLLLIHGSLCDYRYWRWQMDALGAETRVIAPSLRGYWPQALIAESDDFSVAQHASDLAALLGQICREEKTVLLGHSRGAQVALEMALAHPEQTAGVILAAIPAAVAVLSWLFLRERVAPRVWAGVACAVVGIALGTVLVQTRGAGWLANQIVDIFALRQATPRASNTVTVPAW